MPPTEHPTRTQAKIAPYSPHDPFAWRDATARALAGALSAALAGFAARAEAAGVNFEEPRVLPAYFGDLAYAVRAFGLGGQLMTHSDRARVAHLEEIDAVADVAAASLKRAGPLLRAAAGAAAAPPPGPCAWEGGARGFAALDARLAGAVCGAFAEGQWAAAAACRRRANFAARGRTRADMPQREEGWVHQLIEECFDAALQAERRRGCAAAAGAGGGHKGLAWPKGGAEREVARWEAAVGGVLLFQRRAADAVSQYQSARADMLGEQEWRMRCAAAAARRRAAAAPAQAGAAAAVAAKRELRAAAARVLEAEAAAMRAAARARDAADAAALEWLPLLPEDRAAAEEAAAGAEIWRVRSSDDCSCSSRGTRGSEAGDDCGGAAAGGSPLATAAGALKAKFAEGLRRLMRRKVVVVQT